jgi:hypothetical protein
MGKIGRTLLNGVVIAVTLALGFYIGQSHASLAVAAQAQNRDIRDSVPIGFHAEQPSATDPTPYDPNDALSAGSTTPLGVGKCNKKCSFSVDVFFAPDKPATCATAEVALPNCFYINGFAKTALYLGGSPLQQYSKVAVQIRWAPGM